MKICASKFIYPDKFETLSKDLSHFFNQRTLAACYYYADNSPSMTEINIIDCNGFLEKIFTLSIRDIMNICDVKKHMNLNWKIMEYRAGSYKMHKDSLDVNGK